MSVTIYRLCVDGDMENNLGERDTYPLHPCHDATDRHVYHSD